MPIQFPMTFWAGSSGGGSSAPTPTVYWEADYGIVTTTNGTTADGSPVSGNKVLSWTSKDASATVASLGTNANRPTYIVPTYGKPYVTFDGSLSQRLETTSLNSTFNNASAYTIGAFIRKPATYFGYRNDQLLGMNSGNAGMIMIGPSGAGVSFFAGGVTYLGGTRAILAYSTDMVGTTSFFASFSTTSSSTTVAGPATTKIYYDGSLVASDTTSTATVNYTDVITLGGTQDTSTSKAKDVYGFYLYNSQLTDAQVLAVHNAAASRMSVTDKYAVLNSLLLHCDGANGSTTFTDSSSNNLSVTASNATISTSNTMSGFGQVGSFSGASSSYLSLPSSTSFSFGTGDFTVESWIYPATTSGDRVIVAKSQDSYTTGFEWWFGVMNNGTLKFTYVNTSSAFYSAQSTTTISANTWTHVAAVRSGSAVTIYINGVSSGTATAQTIRSTTSSITVARDLETTGGSGRFYTGYIDELRITKGNARYTSNFTPPSSPFPNS